VGNFLSFLYFLVQAESFRWKARTFTVLRGFPLKLDEVCYVLSGDASHDSCPGYRIFGSGLWVVRVGSAAADLNALFLSCSMSKVSD
jgi:hypothetical protein